METQTETDIVQDYNIGDTNENVSISDNVIYDLKTTAAINNSSIEKKQQETQDHHQNRLQDEICDDNAKNLIYDYMNSNEQLSSDEDNVEKLNRRVSQFFTRNRLLQSQDNGNGSIIDNQLLFNIMAARRSCIR